MASSRVSLSSAKKITPPGTPPGQKSSQTHTPVSPNPKNGNSCSAATVFRAMLAETFAVVVGRRSGTTVSTEDLRAARCDGNFVDKMVATLDVDAHGYLDRGAVVDFFSDYVDRVDDDASVLALVRSAVRLVERIVATRHAAELAKATRDAARVLRDAAEENAAEVASLLEPLPEAAENAGGGRSVEALLEENNASWVHLIEVEREARAAAEAEADECRATRDAMTIGRARAEAKLAGAKDQLREARMSVAKISKSPIRFLCGY